MNKTTDFLIHGGKKLAGSVETTGSKNGSVALICAALLNRNTTRLKNIACIEEVNRLVEILEAMDVSVDREEDGVLCIRPPETFNLTGLQHESVSRIRSALMLIPAVSNRHDVFTINNSGGCKMGKRTTVAHVHGLKKLGIHITSDETNFTVTKQPPESSTIIMPEASDTATISILMAAALIPRTTEITFASANYQVQEVCHFLEKLGVEIEGIGTTTLCVRGVNDIDQEILYANSEDPIDSMAFIALAATTNSPLTITRAPIDFLSLELLTLKTMGLSFSVSNQYLAENKKTRLVDISIQESVLKAPEEKIHALPYPGINADNLPFFVPIATQAEGTTLIHDWMWENRAIYYSELNRLGARIELLDPHRTHVHGLTNLTGAQIICPPALRPACIILIAMLAAKGESILRDTYTISRGYENIVPRLNAIGADIQIV